MAHAATRRRESPGTTSSSAAPARPVTRPRGGPAGRANGSRAGRATDRDPGRGGGGPGPGSATATASSPRPNGGGGGRRRRRRRRRGPGPASRGLLHRLLPGSRASCRCSTAAANAGSVRRGARASDGSQPSTDARGVAERLGAVEIKSARPPRSIVPRRLFDGVAMPVPRRATEPARPAPPHVGRAAASACTEARASPWPSLPSRRPGRVGGRRRAATRVEPWVRRDFAALTPRNDLARCARRARDFHTDDARRRAP